MACDVPPRECLEWHIKPQLKGARPKTDGNGYRALCPAHDDHDPSFGASIGDNGKVMYGCFKGCDLLAVRRALIDVYDIGPDHLPIPKRQQQEALDEVRGILVSDTTEDTLVRLRALARIDGYRGLPRGAALLALARLIGIGRSQAFEYGKRERASTANTRHSHPEKSVVNSRTSDRRGGAHRKSGNPDSVRKPGPPEVRKPGLVPSPRDGETDLAAAPTENVERTLDDKPESPMVGHPVPGQREPLDDTSNRRPAA